MAGYKNIAMIHNIRFSFILSVSGSLAHRTKKHTSTQKTRECKKRKNLSYTTKEHKRTKLFTTGLN